jgi:putative hydrolase of the HAD superfamily
MNDERTWTGEVTQNMNIQGIFFDLYGTLLVYGNMKKAWSEWLSTFYHLLKKQGLSISEETFSQECDGFFSATAPASNEDHLTVLERRIQRLCQRLNHQLPKEGLSHIADAIADAWQTHILIDPEAMPVLKALKQKKKMVGLVSNFDHPPHVRRILSHHGLENIFDSTIISSEVGVKKPDPGIFALALQQTGISAADAVYVGDTEADVAGAIAAGIHPIFIARPVNRTDSDALDFQVADPNENLSENRSWENEVTVISSLQEVLHIASR